MKRKSLFGKIIRLTLITCAVILVFGFICYLWIEESAKGRLFENTGDLPECRVGLVLGTARYLAGGNDNLYFTYRMDAAAELYRSGKVKKFILSGDNRVHEYNEPREMKKALIQRGVPDTCLVADYAGLRTFDSMVRCKDIFGQDSVIVVSQRFHNARSVFIADKIGLAAFGYNAKKVTTQKTVRMMVREYFSRIKCVLDLYLFNTQPRHMGEKIKI